MIKFLFKLILFLFLLLTFIVVLNLTLYYGKVFILTTSVQDLAAYKYTVSQEQFDKYNSDDFIIGNENRLPISLENMGCVPEATIAVEDERFFQHNGIDFIDMSRALYKNIVSKSIAEEASTITQELARTLFLNDTKTVARKVEEIIIAQKIEGQLTKERILELYLNLISYKRGYYGVQAASLGYFNKTVDKLTLAECAVISFIPKAPFLFAGDLESATYIERRNMILLKMFELDFINEIDYLESVKAKIDIIF